MRECHVGFRNVILYRDLSLIHCSEGITYAEVSNFGSYIILWSPLRGPTLRSIPFLHINYGYICIETPKLTRLFEQGHSINYILIRTPQPLVFFFKKKIYFMDIS